MQGMCKGAMSRRRVLTDASGVPSHYSPKRVSRELRACVLESTPRMAEPVQRSCTCTSTNEMAETEWVQHCDGNCIV